MKGWLRFKRDVKGGRRTALASLARFAAVVIVLVIAIIAIGEAKRTDEARHTGTPATTTADPLAADLARCRNITAEQLSAVNTCRRVWAENRKRFFTPNKPAEAR